MDALLVTLLCGLLCESGGALSALAQGLARRHRHTKTLIAGLAAAAFVNAALAACGGAWLSTYMASSARALFLGIALVFGGASLWFPVKAPDMLKGWRIAALPTAFLGFVILGFGNAAQFIVMGMTVRTGDVLWAATGGALGGIIACLPAILLQDRPFPPRPLRYLRYAGGAILLPVGASIALSAVELL